MHYASRVLPPQNLGYITLSNPQNLGYVTLSNIEKVHLNNKRSKFLANSLFDKRNLIIIKITISFFLCTTLERRKILIVKDKVIGIQR
jgi:hypothetical protein